MDDSNPDWRAGRLDVARAFERVPPPDQIFGTRIVLIMALPLAAKINVRG